MTENVMGNIARIEEDLERQLKEAEESEAAEAGEAVEGSVKAPEETVKDAETDDAEKAEDLEGDDEGHNDDDKRKRNSAFGRMRAEQKDLRARLEAESKEKQELRERLARLEGRTEAGDKPAPAQADNEPDKDLYPEDHLMWKNRQLEKKLEEVEERTKRFEQDSNVQRAQQAVETIETVYKTSNPSSDYDGAVKFLVDKETAMKKLLNPEMTDAQIRGQIQIEKMQLFAQLHAKGQDPAKVVYETARIHGFSPIAKADPKPKTDLDKVRDNQRRATNLIGGSAASANGNKPSSEQVLGMSMDKLAKEYARNPRIFDEAVDSIN